MKILLLPLSALLVAGGLYVSALSWGMVMRPFRQKADRAFLIVPAQIMIVAGILTGLFAVGISPLTVVDWIRDVMTHGGEGGTG